MEKTLTSLHKLLDLDLKLVNDKIIQHLNCDVSMITELAKHLINAGGKRLRPLLAIACSKLCGYGQSQHIELATCIEFIHTATLLHDDVVDNSNSRRGKMSANKVWGNPSAVLVGDFLFSRAFFLMTDLNNAKILSVLSKASMIMAEGEINQLIKSFDINLCESEYENIISAKTAILFSASCKSSAILAKQNQQTIKQLENYGYNLGMCFQIIDDVLDYTATTQQQGKDSGNDIREKVVTLPVIHSYKTGNALVKEFWKNGFAKDNKELFDAQQALDYLQKTDSIAYAKNRAKHFSHLAINCLNDFPQSDLQKLMVELPIFCLNRIK